MALIQIKAGKVEIVATTVAKAHTVPRALREVPGGLYPMKSAAFEMDEYRLMSGWPVPVPRYDIHASTLVTGDGTTLAERETATSTLTGAAYRWVADADFFNETTGQWVPMQGGEPSWEGTGHLPTLIHDYEYQVDDERFTEMTALNFDSDTADYLTCDLGRVVTTERGYTVVMVMSPNSVFGNEDVDYNGVWCNPPDPNTISLDIILKSGYLEVEFSDKPNQQGIAMTQATSISAPSFLALVINRPTMTMYLGQGPGNILSKSLDVGPEALPFNGITWLGRASADLLHNADMALFDLGLYGNPLDAAGVKDEFAVLSQIYGGD